MGVIYLHAVVSLDGFIADEHDGVGPLHDWYFAGEHPLVEDEHSDVHGGTPFRVSVYHFATSVADGMARAQELAGDGDTGVSAGDVGGQALRLGLLDFVPADANSRQEPARRCGSGASPC